MIVKAQLKNVRISAQKVRLVADLVRGMRAEEALIMLKLSDKKAADPVGKLVKSAVSNAQHNFSLDPAKLTISEIQVGEAKTFKRVLPRARGQADRIQKRGAHIQLSVKSA